MATIIVINRHTGARSVEQTNEIKSDQDAAKTLADLIVKWGLETGEIDHIVNEP